MDLRFDLAPSYRDLKHPTSRQNYYDTPGQIPKLILTLRPRKVREIILFNVLCTVYCGRGLVSLESK